MAWGVHDSKGKMWSTFTHTIPKSLSQKNVYISKCTGRAANTNQLIGERLCPLRINGPFPENKQKLGANGTFLHRKGWLFGEVRITSPAFGLVNECFCKNLKTHVYLQTSSLIRNTYITKMTLNQGLMWLIWTWVWCGIDHKPQFPKTFCREDRNRKVVS